MSSTILVQESVNGDLNIFGRCCRVILIFDRTRVFKIEPVIMENLKYIKIFYYRPASKALILTLE